LAAKGLYKLQEYYSQEVYDELPHAFPEYKLARGVVPPNLVSEEYVNKEKKFYYQGDNKKYPCIQQQKGTAAVDQHEQGAIKEFATNTKKVYMTYKRNKGKVRYVEIYSLFYYTSLSGDVEFAIRHTPVMMVAEYLESIGIKVRVYMTRFVQLKKAVLRDQTVNGVDLPMTKAYNKLRTKITKESLFLQPIIVKDFGEEFDKALAMMVSSRSYSKVYQLLAENSIAHEATNDMDVYGHPDWEQIEYIEGFERYRNKYLEYVKLGLFKSKEVLPEAMMLFHDIVIKQNFSDFADQLSSFVNISSDSDSEGELLSNINTNHFFAWWMRLSANELRNKVEIVNSKELRKDLLKMRNLLQDLVLELDTIVSEANSSGISNRGETLGEFYKRWGMRILGATTKQYSWGGYEYGYDMIDANGLLTFPAYVEKITNELTTYAEDGLYDTKQEEMDKRNALLEEVIRELEFLK
jgi:hypothetical protein